MYLIIRIVYVGVASRGSVHGVKVSRDGSTVTP